MSELTLATHDRDMEQFYVTRINVGALQRQMRAQKPLGTSAPRTCSAVSVSSSGSAARDRSVFLRAMFLRAITALSRQATALATKEWRGGARGHPSSGERGLLRQGAQSPV